MSDNKPPKPPPSPDDFSKTVPNIKIPQSDDTTHDWEKTNYNFSPQPPSDDWGNTVSNIDPHQGGTTDFDQTFNPSSNNAREADWGVTRGNINVSPDDFGAAQDGGVQDYGATTPYFRLPEAERAKYQEIPPTPTEAAKKRREEEKENRGIPWWAWIAGGLATMFLFAVVILVGVYFFFYTTPGYELVINNVPRESRITVNGSDLDVTTPNEGTRKIQNLKAGEQKKIEITAPNYKCDSISGIVGQDGEIVTRNAECSQVVQVSSECDNLKSGDYQKSQKCAEEALGKLGDPMNLDDLLKALNLAIIKFDSNSSDISDDQKDFLKVAARYLKKVPENVVIEIGGHTDNVGEDAANQSLSEKRADSVKSALVSEEVNESSLAAKGYGEKKPVASNENETGRFYNRRIEYSIAKQ